MVHDAARRRASLPRRRSPRPAASPITHTQGSIVYSRSKTSLASSQPASVAPIAASTPASMPSAVNSAATPGEHDAPARAERAQHRALVAALVAGRLDGSEQHGEAGRQREQEHVLHGERGAVDDVAHLREDRVDVEHGHGREAPHEVGEHRPLLRVELHAREPGAGEAVERAGREHEEEVRAGTCPTPPRGSESTSASTSRRRRRRRACRRA